MFRIDYHHCDLILYQNMSSLRRMEGKNSSTDPELWCIAFVHVWDQSKPCDMSREPPVSRRLFIYATTMRGRWPIPGKVHSLESDLPMEPRNEVEKL